MAICCCCHPPLPSSVVAMRLVDRPAPRIALVVLDRLHWIREVMMWRKHFVDWNPKKLYVYYIWYYTLTWYWYYTLCILILYFMYIIPGLVN
jgi:hypothetical protein